MRKNKMPEMVISLYYVPGATAGGHVPDIGSVTLDSDTAAGRAVPVTNDNFVDLSDGGLEHLGKIDVMLMDTVEEAHAVVFGMGTATNKQAAAYKNPFGFGLVLTCDPTQEPGVELFDYRKPARHAGAVQDRVSGSWQHSKKEYDDRFMSDEEVELQLNRYARRLAEMANAVGPEALQDLQDATEDLMLEDELEFAMSEPGM